MRIRCSFLCPYRAQESKKNRRRISEAWMRRREKGKDVGRLCRTCGMGSRKVEPAAILDTRGDARAVEKIQCADSKSL